MAKNVCDACLKGYPSQILERDDFGQPVHGDWCFNCGLVYDTHNGWRAPTGLETMERSMDDDRL